jgi:hypothetical protein
MRQIHKKPGGNHRAFFLVRFFNFYILLNNEYEDHMENLMGHHLKAGIPSGDYSASPTV